MRRIAPLLLALAAGCASRVELMATPRLYQDAATDPFASVPAELRTSDVELLFVTDRRREGEGYGAERSRSAAYGTCALRLGDGLSWEKLVALSRAAERDVPVGLEVVDIQERGRWPETPYPLRVKDGRVELDPSVVDARDRAMRGFQELLRSRLRTSKRKEVLIFIHGYNNQFDSPAMVLGQVAHFLGREFVPILYSWPAGSGGLLRGYTMDRESGEFTIYHLKELLKTLAACEELEGAHVLAHSRGTDIATTALREMLLERGHKVNERDPKLKTLILAAPDLDAEVITQRLGAEGLVHAPGRTVIYTSSGDRALGLAAWLFRSVARLGSVRTEELSPAVVEQLRRHPKLQVVDAQVTGYGSGHDYFYAHPAVSSDLILLLREGLDPGPRRPLALNERACWTLGNDYPTLGHELR